MPLLTVTAENFESLISGDKTLLLDFWATWCGPCQMLSPIIDEIAEENGDVTVGKINVDEEPQLAGNFGIDSIPTLVVMKNREEKNRSVGLVSKSEILDLLK